MSEAFCGWYFKCQSGDRTIAVIPARHETGGKKSCSIQVITERGTWSAPYSLRSFRELRGRLAVKIGENIFCEKGMKLKLRGQGLRADGTIKFGPLSPLRYDIMGPFCFMPFMECRHSVFSMSHSVAGRLTVNGEQYRFADGEGAGYIEGDRGRSFPGQYAWTQCLFDGGSLMLSVADIPVGPFHFTGIIGVIVWMGKEYRLATYLGARAMKAGGGELVIRQGKTRFGAKLLEKNARPLRAPKSGAMTRTIRENAACRARYYFEKNGEKIFDFESPNASFEYEFPT